MHSIATTSEALAPALQVAELGLRVHPLIGKRPIWDDWPAKATSERAAVEQMMTPGRNYGIVCDRVAVIDTDTAELAEWWQQHMPRTPWVVRTPRGTLLLSLGARAAQRHRRRPRLGCAGRRARLRGGL